MSEPLLQVQNIACSYIGNKKEPVVKNLSFSLYDGEIGCLLGPSGCGKTTVLRAIAGFHKIDSGSISLNSQILNHPPLYLPPESRKIGMVFQDYALFPHLSVHENIVFGLKNLTRKQKIAISDELLSLVKLQGFSNRYPHELSGGQQQRIALARALAPSPLILLLDEPLSSLDTDLRRNLAIEIREILKYRGISAIMVTHDQQEAFSFSDQIGVMNNGLIEQWDSPTNIYHNPSTSYIAKFVGECSLIKGQVLANGFILTELGLLNNNGFYPGDYVEVLVRPSNVEIVESSSYKGIIINKSFLGESILYKVELESGLVISVNGTYPSNYEIHQSLGLKLSIQSPICFPILHP